MKNDHIMRRRLLAMLSVAAFAPLAGAQHYDMLQWGADRGYYDAPYFRYEAEPHYCVGFDGQYLGRTDDQLFFQSEASNQQAITLGREGYVEWRNDSGDADGVTLRFSVPWGSSAKVAILGGNGENLGEMVLNTDHSWQYCEKRQGSRTDKPETYSIHVRNDNEFVRMRFDETHRRLSRAIAQGETFRIVNLSETPVTVDFLEIEKTHKVEFKDGWTRWTKEIDGNLQNFINSHPGQTIYIDEEYVGVRGKLNLGSANLQGRGMWYTELHWEGDGAGFNGFGGSVRDMYLSSYQNQRYDSPNHSANGYGSPGKCFNGSAGHVENVWVEHFECGGWLSGANGSYFTNCRFRNNYADGMNFCNSSNCILEHSSFRNNGDDDMASWSAESYCSNNIFRFNTAEHNWRASSLGFFGGGGHHAHNILVKDGMENGVRLVSDFPGPSFGNEGIRFSDITIVHCACIDGPVGRHGDFWGVNEGALHIEASKNYSIVNPVFENIDIIDSRGNAVFIGSGTHNLTNVRLNNITIDGVSDPGSYAVYFENPRGNASLSDITIGDVDNGRITNINGGSLESTDMGGFNLVVGNVTTAPVVLIPGCELSLGGLAWEPADRRVESVLRDGDDVIFSVRIDNHSDIDLPEGYTVDVFLSFDNGSSVAFPALKEPIDAGDYKVLSVTWKAVEGGHTVSAVLDPKNRYDHMTPAERGTIIKKINVAVTDIRDIPFERTSGVDFQPLDLRWKIQGESEFRKGSVREGDRVVFAAGIANTGTEDSPGSSKLGVIISPSGNDWTPADNDIRWCDMNEAYEPLDAGQVRYFQAYGGNATSDGIWIARKGTYNVLVHANDHANESGNRREDNTANKSRRFSITIPFVSNPLHEMADSPDDLYVETGVRGIDASRDVDCGWFALTGMRLDRKPEIPGLYINNGRKVLIRGRAH